MAERGQLPIELDSYELEEGSGLVAALGRPARSHSVTRERAKRGLGCRGGGRPARYARPFDYRRYRSC